MDAKTKKQVTIRDVASRAGVSFKTVSRVVNGEPYVREETRQKVLRAVESLNFKVNGAARALRSKTAKRLVLGLNNPSQSYTEAVQVNAVLACQPFGFELSLQGRIDIEILKTARLSGELVGVILVPPLCDDAVLIERLEAEGIPCVRLGAQSAAGRSDRVGIDDRTAAADMTRYLVSLGHRRIGFVGGEQSVSASESRLLGYHDALSQSGTPADPALVVYGDFSYASGLAGVEALLSLQAPPTAIFASNDEMAAACLAGAYRRGLRVPEMLSVAGFDDAPFSRIISPSLTTVRQPIDEMMAQAVAILAQRRSAPSAPLRDVIIDHTLVIRESSSAHCSGGDAGKTGSA